MSGFGPSESSREGEMAFSHGRWLIEGGDHGEDQVHIEPAEVYPVSAGYRKESIDFDNTQWHDTNETEEMLSSQHMFQNHTYILTDHMRLGAKSGLMLRQMPTIPPGHTMNQRVID